MLIKLLTLLFFMFSNNICVAAHKETKVLNIQSITSNYGFRAFLLEDHNVPIISMVITFKNAGYAYDPADKQGLAAMVAELMMEGAGKRSSVELIEIMESKGIELSFDADIDSLNITLKTLTKNIDIAMELLRDALVVSSFESSCIERVKSRFAVAHRAQDSNPTSLGAKKFMELAFKDHPYSQSKLGDSTTIKNINAKDLLQYIRRVANRVNIVISAVGDVSKSKLFSLLDEYLIDLPLVSENSKIIADITPQQEVGSAHLEKDFIQSAVLFGHQGISPSDPKYYAALIMNHVIGGGGFQSILLDELREKRGLVYGIKTELRFYDHAYIWHGRTSTTNPDSVTELIRELIEKVKREGISEFQLEDAKNNIISSLILNLNTNSKIASLLQTMQLLNFDKNYIEKLPERIEEVSTSDVLDAAQEILDPTKLIFVSVGNK